MAKVSVYTYLEKWADGTERIVLRESGRFYDNISLTSLRKAPAVTR